MYKIKTSLKNKLSLSLKGLAITTSLLSVGHAFDISPQTITITAKAQAHEQEYTIIENDIETPVTYRFEANDMPPLGDGTTAKELTITDVDGNPIDSITVTKGTPAKFKVKYQSQNIPAPKRRWLLVALDSRAKGKEYTGNMVFIRQGVNIYVAPDPITVPIAPTNKSAVNNDAAGL